MKKGIALLLIITHLFSSVGFSMSIHHCGKNVSYKIGKLELNKKCKCKVEVKAKSSKCCKNEQVIVKADKKDRSSSQSRIQLSIVSFSVFTQALTGLSNEAFPSQKVHSSTKGPPGNTSPPFLKNHSFRI